MKSKLLLTGILIIVSFYSMGQLVVNTSIYTAEELVQDILINGNVTADSISTVGSCSGSYTPIGYFSYTGSEFPFSAGIIMSTGHVQDAPGSGGVFISSSLANSAGDPDLDLMLGGSWTSNDATILEFDFIPTSDTLQLRYIFASEEYNEFISGCTDVMGIFISGPGINGLFSNNAENIALVPGTSDYVSCININDIIPANPQYFVENQNGTVTVYDGMTTPLTAYAIVTPYETYHIKFAIGDAGDHAYDTGIFIEAGSFSSGEVASITSPPIEKLSINQEVRIYPNPSTGEVTLKYQLPEGEREGELVLYDMQGAEVKRYRVDNTFSEILLDNTELPAGTYFYQLQTCKGAVGTKKMVVVR